MRAYFLAFHRELDTRYVGRGMVSVFYKKSHVIYMFASIIAPGGNKTLVAATKVAVVDEVIGGVGNNGGVGVSPTGGVGVSPSVPSLAVVGGVGGSH